MIKVIDRGTSEGFHESLQRYFDEYDQALQ